jgi:hypothetical protein
VCAANLKAIRIYRGIPTYGQVADAARAGDKSAQVELRRAFRRIRGTLRKQARSEFIGPDWLPTPGAVNALPEPLRRYIHDLKTNVEPAWLIRQREK